MADLAIRRGATYDEPLSLGMDLTGATVYFTVKSDYDDDMVDSTAVIQKDITVHDDEVAGISRLTLSSTDTTIPTGKYKFDLHVKVGSVVTPYEPANLTIQPSVTLRS